ncbi:MAG: TIGR04076 family protein [Anaerolineaceae bacterium]
MESTHKPEQFDVIATVVSQKGLCHAGYKAGDQIAFCQNSISGAPVCYSALDCLLSSVILLRYGASYPWTPDGIVQLACPDAENPVVFELKRQIPNNEG